MAKTLIIRPQANLDIVGLAEYIGKNNVTAADRFLDACTQTFKLLAQSPYIGGRYPAKSSRLRDLRVFRVKGFPQHLAFYVESASGIEVVRVLHGARDLDAALGDASAEP